MLDFDGNRVATTPRDASTTIVLRDSDAGLEVFCVERNRKSGFMGGAIVFPGGKVDVSDTHDAWAALTTEPNPRGRGFADNDRLLRSFAIAACRESLEEAAILPVYDAVFDDDAARSLRDATTRKIGSFRDLVERAMIVLNLRALTPFAHWVTPEAETRRFSARFFLLRAPQGQLGAHDEFETMASFWATPSAVLARFDADEIQLAPPTHRSLEILARARSVDDALAASVHLPLTPCCPRLVSHRDSRGETLALVLPGDPEHEIATAQTPGKCRYVLRGERWRPEDPP